MLPRVVQTRRETFGIACRLFPTTDHLFESLECKFNTHRRSKYIKKSTNCFVDIYTSSGFVNWSWLKLVMSRHDVRYLRSFHCFHFSNYINTELCVISVVLILSSVLKSKNTVLLSLIGHIFVESLLENKISGCCNLLMKNRL